MAAQSRPPPTARIATPLSLPPSPSPPFPVSLPLPLSAVSRAPRCLAADEGEEEEEKGASGLWTVTRKRGVESARGMSSGWRRAWRKEKRD
eukprot:3254367-Rhodomonas_salina.3